MDQGKRGVERKRSRSPVDSESSNSSSSSGWTLYDLGNYKEAMERGVSITHKNVVPTYDAFGSVFHRRFPRFGRLPQELQNHIWLEALRAEARRTIVVYDANTGRLIPSVKLVSKVSKANKAAYTSAMEFFNFQIEVFACVRNPPHMIPECRRAKGILRLNLDYTTLLLDFHCLHGTRWSEKAVKFWSGTTPKRDDENTEFWIARRHITSPLSPSQCALVKRIYEFSYIPDRDSKQGPHCCWDCEWLLHDCNPRYAEGAVASFARRGHNPFANVWLARLLVIDSQWTRAGVLLEYSNIDHHEWWAIVYSTRLVTCVESPVRSIGFDEFEVESNPDEE